MRKEKNVIKFYCLCNKLKDLVRTGWCEWNIDRSRVESVAEHIYGVEMIALAMYSEYEFDIDIRKVMMMIAVHELEEILIGDISVVDKKHISKKEKGHAAVKEILSSLSSGKEIEDLIHEFDDRKTQEARFAYHCDKLECDLQAKIYDEENAITLDNQKNNEELNSELAQSVLREGNARFADIWFKTDEHHYEDDDNFKNVYLYALKNDICNLKDDNES